MANSIHSYEVLLALVRAALNGGDGGILFASPAFDATAVDWKSVHALSSRQGVQGIVWCGVEAAGLAEALPCDLRGEWSTRADGVLRRLVLFDAEREEVFGAFHAAGLATLPLKGSSLARHYPDPRMRHMADNDFLYGFVQRVPGSGDYRLIGETPDDRRETVRRGVRESVRIMRDRGYKVANHTKGAHESFHKDPMYNFEAHRVLFPLSSPLYAAFGDPWSRVVPDADAPVDAHGTPLSFHFIAEDEFAYVLAHAFKHYDNSGCGMRFLIDLEVLRRSFEDSLERDLVEARLDELGIGEWGRRMCGLSFEAFAPAGRGDFDAAQRVEMEFLMQAGAYGTLGIRVERSIARERENGAAGMTEAKLRYVRSRLFGSDEMLRDAFPFFYEHRWALPVLPVYRLTRGFLRGNVQRELRELRKLH